MDDDVFARALNACLRYRRRQARTEQPKGHRTANGRWWPSPEEGLDVVGHARAPTNDFPDAYRMHCRNWRHCEALAGADRSSTMWVDHWLAELKQHFGKEPSDPAALREAAKLAQCLDAMPPAPKPPRRPRL